MPDSSNKLNLQYFYENVHKKILIDTCVLLLLLVGASKLDVSKVKCTKDMYTNNDYECLLKILRPFEIFFTTPHILTEVNSFIGKEDKFFKKKICKKFREWISSGAIEVCIKAETLLDKKTFNYLGLTDTALIKFDHHGEITGILTKDGGLYIELTKQALPVLNFTHYMEKANKRIHDDVLANYDDWFPEYQRI